MRRLAQQHTTREAEIDSWLRGELLVDLLPIVTSSIVLGEPSYSIKKVEHLYLDARQAGVTNAGDSSAPELTVLHVGSIFLHF